MREDLAAVRGHPSKGHVWLTIGAVGSSGDGSDPRVLHHSTEEVRTMEPMATKHHPTPEERDERVSVPLEPAEFIEGVLAVEPDEDEPADGGGD